MLASYPEQYKQTANHNSNAVQPRMDYDQYIKNGQLTLEIAMEKEQDTSLAVAANLYETASVQFLGAIGSTPLVANTLPEPDPILLLQYATCVSKVVASSQVTPYRSQQSRHHNRSARLSTIAERTFLQAWQQIVTDPSPDSTTIAETALVTAHGLHEVEQKREADLVLHEARLELHHIDDTDPRLISLVDQQAAHTSTKKLYSQSEIASEALRSLTLGRHDDMLAMAA